MQPNSAGKTTVEFVDMSKDDEENLLVKIMKVELPEDEDRFLIPGFQKPPTISGKTQTTSTEKSTHTAVMKHNTELQAEGDQKFGIPAEFTPTTPEDKRKKRMKLLQKLDGLRLQQKINETERELRELDEEQG